MAHRVTLCWKEENRAMATHGICVTCTGLLWVATLSQLPRSVSLSLSAAHKARNHPSTATVPSERARYKPTQTWALTSISEPVCCRCKSAVEDRHSCYAGYRGIHGGEDSRCCCLPGYTIQCSLERWYQLLGQHNCLYLHFLAIFWDIIICSVAGGTRISEDHIAST
jgi:hypothetical protein